MKRLFILMTLSFMALSLSAQNMTVSGVVTDDLGEPLSGAFVMQKGTTNGAMTDLDGAYTISVPSDATLVASFMGFLDSEAAVAGRAQINFSLATDALMMEEVVVVGYGTQKSKDLTAPIVNVKGDALAKQATANPMSALSGMVSGVQITQSGAPGAGPTVKIRGVGSIGDYANPLYVVDGAFMDNIDFLASSDIESLTVLKDASASAIYGVRAANGVIIVTTKKGQAGHTRVTYDGYAGVQVPTNIMKLANTQQYCELYNMAFEGTTGFVPKNPSDFTADTDWYAELVKPALTHSHSVDLSGGTEKSNYSVGLSYFYQDGIMNYCTNDYDRLNFRARLDQNMTNWLKVGFNTVISTHDKKNANSGVYYQAFVNPPVYGVYNEANTDAYPEPFDSPQRYGYANAYGNPAASAYYHDSKEKGFKTVFSAYAEATIIPEKLKFKTSYNLDFYFYDARNYAPENYVGGSQGSTTSSLSKTYGYGQYHILDNTLTYTDSVGPHSFSAMIGQSTRMQYNASLTGTANSVPGYDEQSKYLVNGSYKNQTASDGASRYNGLSFFTRGTYNYKGKYLATVTLRADGSSKYQEKWGIFPSVGLAWNMSDEDFMQDQNVFDFLKIRASWGMLGNDNVPANSTSIVGTSGVGASGVFGGTVVDGVGAQTVYQNFLRWEVVTEYNIGADFAFLSNRLSGELDVYSRITDNVVFHAPVATGGGVATLLANNGKVLNAGVELSLKWADSVGDFNYNLGFNATFNKNQVLELKDRDFIPGASVAGDYATRTKVGLPIGAFWGYKVDGVFASEKEAIMSEVAQQGKEAGALKYHDEDGNGSITEDDKTYLGSPWPWLMCGFTAGFEWKNLDFSMVVSANIGNKILNSKRMNKNVFADANYDLDYYENCWTPDRTNAIYPSPKALQSGSTLTCNEFFLEDGSMLRIQNIQIGYTFREVFGKGSIRAYLSAQRPLSIFGYNGFTTEIGGSPISTGIDGSSVYPMQSIYTLGVNLNF
ncbi:MAG: TonB-dependent receptor [Bacteroidales bacterium]|nr:TonB-dependent receptor [Bacteroidales bacterium]